MLQFSVIGGQFRLRVGLLRDNALHVSHLAVNLAQIALGGLQENKVCTLCSRKAGNVLIIVGEKEKTNTNQNQLASLCNVRV